MANVTMDCTNKTALVIQPYLKKLQAFHHENICICEIQENTSFDQLSKYHGRYIFIIQNGTHILEILDFKPLAIWRQQFLEKDIKTYLEEKNTMISFQSGKNTLYVNTSQIIYIESYLHYLIIHTAGTTFKVRSKISDALLQLKPYGFVQIHRSYLINRRCLMAYTDKYCLLRDQIELPVGDKFKNQLLNSGS